MSLELALAGLVLICAGALAGAGIALARSSRQPPTDLQVALETLRAERARDKAELAELAERMMDAGDRIARARQRHETAKQRLEQREQNAEPEQPPLSELEAVKLRARRLGKL
jgi:chromosome segregation ATPase